MATAARKGEKGKKRLFSPPLSTDKESKKSREEVEREEAVVEVDEMEGGGDGSKKKGIDGPLVDMLTMHETISTKISEALAALKPASGDESDAFMRMVPALATAVSIAVGAVMSEVLAKMEQRMQLTTRAPAASDAGLRAAVRHLTYDNDRLQQYSRRESVRIFGVRQEERESGEEVEKKVMEVLKDAGVDAVPDDIAACHRAGRKQNGTRPILVKFVSRRKRRELMVKKKNLKKNDKYARVFIGDDLTPLRARLLGYVKRLPQVEKAWVIDGRIHVQRKFPPGLHPNDQPRPIVVETPDDLFHLGVDDVDYQELGLTHLAFGGDGAGGATAGASEAHSNR